MAVPYTFGSATAAIPLSQLDSNFATTITLGNTAIQLGNTVTTLNNMTLVNTTISSGNVTVTNANVTSITATSDSYISGLTVGKGAGAVSTNTAVGASALLTNSTGDNNTAVGNEAGYSNSTGVNNVAVGSLALRANTASQNVAMGVAAMYANTFGTQNVAIGSAANYASMRYNTTGSYNVAVGAGSLAFNTVSDRNTAIGYQAAYSFNRADLYGRNVVVGYQALYTSTTSNENVAIGTQAGYSSNTSGQNVFVGQETGYSTTGGYNTFVGYQAGFSVTTGAKNTIIGKYSGNQGGLDIRTASNYIVLSDGDGTPWGYQTGGAWTFGYDTTGSVDYGRVNLRGTNASGYGPRTVAYANGVYVWQVGSYSAIISGTNQYLTCANTSGGVYLNGASATSWTAVSDETRKVIIEPITDAANKVATLRTVIGRLKSDEEDVRRPYLIAQDVQAVLPEAVSESEDKEGPVLGLSYTEVIPLLVAAIKELKADLDATKAELAALKENK